jgi:hypothetical protein
MSNRMINPTKETKLRNKCLPLCSYLLKRCHQEPGLFKSGILLVSTYLQRMWTPFASWSWHTCTHPHTNLLTCKQYLYIICWGIMLCKSHILYSMTQVKMKFTLWYTIKAQRMSRLQLYSFFNLVTRWSGWWSCPSHFTPGKRRNKHFMRAEWAPGLVRVGA